MRGIREVKRDIRNIQEEIGEAEFQMEYLEDVINEGQRKLEELLQEKEAIEAKKKSK